MIIFSMVILLWIIFIGTVVLAFLFGQKVERIRWNKLIDQFLVLNVRTIRTFE